MRSQQKQMASGAQLGAGEATCVLVSRWIADGPFGWPAAGWNPEVAT